MTVIQNLDQLYIDTQLICPPGKSRIEIVDPERTGMYIEVRAASPGQGTFYLRYKNSNGKTQHQKIGRTSEIQLKEARAEGAKFKASICNVIATAGAPETSKLILEKPALGSSTRVMTLDVFMTEHYFPYAKLHKRSHWRDEQLYRIRIKPKFGHLPLLGITRLAVQSFQTELLGQGLSKASVNHHIQLLRRVLNLAVSWEMLERNVLKGVPMFHLDNQRNIFLTDEQVDDLVTVLRNHENRNVSSIVLFLLATGSRLNEGLTAEWKDVDEVKKLWRIPATNSKSKKMKSLPLNKSAIWLLDQLGSRNSSRYLFPSPVTGKPYIGIARAWQVIRRKAGLSEEFRIHDLRHTFASRLVSAGHSLYEVQILLGHSDPRMSQRYAHLSSERAMQASSSAAFSVH